MDARELACRVVMDVTDREAMSHIALRRALDACPEMAGRDRRFAARLVQGTLEHLLTIDAKLNAVSKTPVRKMKPFVRALLRVSAYQLLYLDSVPASAVCSEAVKLAKRRGFAGLSGFVNGVLRTIARDPSLPDGDLALRYSMPAWITNRFLARFGEEETERILQAFLEPRPVTVRRNLSRVSEKDFLASLAGDGAEAEPLPLCDGCYFLKNYERIDRLEAFRKGWLFVQDVSSMLAAEAAGVRPGQAVLDVCAAPGGKTFYVADRMENRGRIVACDKTEAKAALLAENRDRCGFSSVEIRVRDAREPEPAFTEAFDLVIADLPCSGLGTLGHKPEIRYRVTEAQIRELAALQREILSQVWRYVKPGGVLLYSTCTMTVEENEENISWFLSESPFAPDSLDPYLPESLRGQGGASGSLTLIPGRHTGDGFFLARCRRTS